MWEEKKRLYMRGVLKENYPSLFIVKLDNGEDSYERVSLRHTAVLKDSIDNDFSEKIRNFVL